MLDGSAAPLVFLLDCAGIAKQEAPRRVIEVLRTVRVRRARHSPNSAPASCRLLTWRSRSISSAAAIGRQALSLRLRRTSFRHELARARTFALAERRRALRAAGLARGGSLDNAVVVDGARVLNPGGLRMADEFVRHKLLDAVGDLGPRGRAAARPVRRAPLRPRAEQPAAARPVRRRRGMALAAAAHAGRPTSPGWPPPQPRERPGRGLVRFACCDGVL